MAPFALAISAPAFAQDHGPHQASTPAASAPAAQHAGHNPAAEQTTSLPEGAQSGPPHAADLYHDPAVMARARGALLAETGAMSMSAVLIDRIEAGFGDGEAGYAWDVQGWRGGDIDRFWWKSEGDGVFADGVDSAELQLLYSRAVTPYFDLQAGLRQSYRRAGDRTDLVLGVQGLAPYWFDVSAEVFVSNEGEFTARASAEYDLRLTQRLILQPSAEIIISAQDSPELDIAAGATDAEFGARLRYEVRRDFAPYVGVVWKSALGDTRDLREAHAEDPDAAFFVVGLHAFF